MRKYKTKNPKIDPEYNGRIYGYKMSDYKTLIELSTLYEQILVLNSRKVRSEVIKAIQKRAVVLVKSGDKKIIKEIFKNN